MKGDGKVIFWAIFLSIISMVGMIGFGIIIAIYINGGSDFSRLFSNKKTYEVTMAAKDLPVYREKPKAINLDEFYHLRELLETKKFYQLNKILQEYQTLFLSDQTNEYLLSGAYESFYTTYPYFEALLLEWMNQYPNNYQSYLAIAKYFYAKAWESRGHKYFGETSYGQIKVMQSYLLKSEENVRKALEINPHLLPAYELLIGIYNTDGNDEAENRTINNAIDLFPSSFIVWSKSSWAKQPRWGGSYQEMEYLSKKAEKYYDLNPRLSTLYGCIYYDQGRMEVLGKNYDKAIDLLNKAQVYGDYTIFNFELANAYYRNKQYETALKHLNKSIQLNSISADNYILHAKIYALQEKYIESIEKIHIAEQINPGYSYLLSSKEWLSKVFLYKGQQLVKQKPDETLELFNFAIQLNDKNYEAYYLRGMALSYITHFKSGLSDFQKAIELNPHHFESYRMIDYTLMQTRQWDRILEYWNKFLELEPNHAEAYFERSGTYYHNKDMKHALADLEKACELGHEKACNKYKALKVNGE